MDEELKSYLEGMEIRIKEYVDERTHDAETRLLRAFSDFNTNWASGCGRSKPM